VLTGALCRRRLQLRDPFSDRLPRGDAILAALPGAVDDPIKGMVPSLITKANDDMLSAGYGASLLNPLNCSGTLA